MLKAKVQMVVVQGVSHLDAEMGALRNLLTNTAVLVNALKEVAQPSLKPAAAQPKPDGSANGSRVDMDWLRPLMGSGVAAPPTIAICAKRGGLRTAIALGPATVRAMRLSKGGPMHWTRSTQR